MALCVHFDTTPFGFKCQKPVQLCKVLTNIDPAVKCNNINYVSICAKKQVDNIFNTRCEKFLLLILISFYFYAILIVEVIRT